MKSFLSKIAVYMLLLLLATAVFLVLVSELVKSRDFGNHETESNLLVMPKDSAFDALFMGISHARNFSRYNNHSRVENILDAHILNIGQGGGFCGVNEQLFYLDYFYYKGNSCRKMVYFLSPPLLFSDKLPIASGTFLEESFELPFLLRYLGFESENKLERINAYIQSKRGSKWINYQPFSVESMTDVLPKIDSAIIQKGFQLAYNKDNKLNMERYEKSCTRLKETIELARLHQSEVILIIPPAVFGKWNGHEEVVAFGKKMAEQEGVSFYDHAETFTDIKLYYDHHHLNTKGIELYTKKYLLPVFWE